MVSATEAAANSKTSLASELQAGVDWLSLNQSVTFTAYQKYIFPADGFVYWVKTAVQSVVKGSLHYSTEVEQEEESTIAINTMIFTAESQIDNFQQISPTTLYIATFDGIQFSFNTQGKYYKQANLWHYAGVAVKARQTSQIIDDSSQVANIKLIVSNSLPIWLAMPSYVPPYPGFTCPIANMYPSFLVPDNAQPPYAAVHIERTESLVEAALLGRRLESSQLASEIVRVTTYGVDNDDIITFLNFVLQYSYDWNYIGMMNMPIILDEKDPQSELTVISQKKTIEFKVSYLQNSVRDVARQFILACVVGNQANYGPNGPISPQGGVIVKPVIPAPSKLEHYYARS